MCAWRHTAVTQLKHWSTTLQVSASTVHMFEKQLLQLSYIIISRSVYLL